MTIDDMRKEAETLRKQITTIGNLLPQSDGEDKKAKLAEWREMNERLAIVEDILDAQAKRSVALRKSSNLGRRFAQRTFSNFEPKGNERAYEFCKQYAMGYSLDEGKNGIIMVGDYGTGKTHLASAISNALLDRGIPVLFDTFGGHLEKLKAEFDGGSNAQYLKLMREVPMLVIDDVGKEKQTEWSQSIMYDVINHRYEDMTPVIITSNMGDRQLQEYFGGACFSRLISMCNLVVTRGEDWRKKGAY